jgi:hypothetical protein
MTTWTPEEIAAIDAAHEIEIAARRRANHHAPTQRGET